MTPNFEEILLELSYRIPQGIVDLTNEQHLNELISILEENRVPNAKQLALEAKQSLEKLLATTFKNPETGNLVKVDSALRYKKASPAYKIASSMLDKGGYSEDDLETVDAGPDDEEKPNVFGKIFFTQKNFHVGDINLFYIVHNYHIVLINYLINF
mgnify:CR=1 FL=1